MMLTQKSNSRRSLVLFITVILLTVISQKGRCQTINDTLQQQRKNLPVYENGVLDTPAAFPEGKKAMDKFLKDNFKVPDDVSGSGLKHIIVNFIVEPDGAASNTRILRGLGSDAEREAIRALIAQMPKFSPAVHKGKAVRVSFTVAIPID